MGIWLLIIIIIIFILLCCCSSSSAGGGLFYSTYYVYPNNYVQDDINARVMDDGSTENHLEDTIMPVARVPMIQRDEVSTSAFANENSVSTEKTSSTDWLNMLEFNQDNTISNNEPILNPKIKTTGTLLSPSPKEKKNQNLLNNTSINSRTILRPQRNK